MTIKPTVGQAVLYYPAGADRITKTINEQPHVGFIAHVLSDGRVNLSIFDSAGKPYNRTGVKLLDQDDERPTHEAYCVLLSRPK
jgi:hypothetical protein